MLYSDISLFTYVQIVVYFLNAAFQFYTSIGGGGGGAKLECYGTANTSYLTSFVLTLCGVEDSLGACFTTAYTGEKK